MTEIGGEARLLNVCKGSEAEVQSLRSLATASRSKPAAQITGIASLPQAEIGQMESFAYAHDAQKETRRSGFLMLVY